MTGENAAPSVTVLMSCYNAARWLHQAIESVLRQTTKNFEFILLDDGSTDETWSIIQDYCNRDARIVAISKKNTGLADSLNVGIAQARGEWIARLDADDLCESTRLEEQIKFVHKHTDVVLVGTGCLEIDEHGRFTRKRSFPTKHQTLVRRLERLQPFFPHSSAFYRTDLARQAGGYNGRIRRAEDLRLWLEISLQGQLACLPKPLVRIRTHAFQISREDNYRRAFFDATAATICHFLRKAGYKDPSVHANEADWIIFLKWVEKQTDVPPAFERLKVWRDARASYFAAGNKATGLIHFANRLLKSGHASALMLEKYFGSLVPQRLAREWMKRTYAAL
jgi:glycosyltransferase involved in cell wall biosynthesis